MNIFQEIALLRRLQKPLTQLQEILAMKFSSNMLLQLIHIAAQLLNASGTLVPPDKKMLVAGILAGLDGIVSAIAHYSNTDGTPQKVANTDGSVK